MKEPNSHDKYFKEVFSVKEHALDFLKAALYPEILKKMDLRTLKPIKDSYVNEELKENFSDLVYTCRYKGDTDIKITLLFEHKSKPVKYPHIQLLKYLLNLWEADLKQNDKLTPVIPIVFYHGKRTWKQKPFTEYFKGIDKELERFLPSFDYILNDLSHLSDEEIAERYNNIKVRTALLLMKNIFNENLLKRKISFIFVKSNEILSDEEGEKFFTATFYYLYFNIESDYKAITKEIKQITDKGGKIAMSIATRLINEGIQQGAFTKEAETIIKLSKAGLTITQISVYLELKESYIKKILKDAGLMERG